MSSLRNRLNLRLLGLVLVLSITIFVMQRSQISTLRSEAAQLRSEIQVKRSSTSHSKPVRLEGDSTHIGQAREEEALDGKALLQGLIADMGDDYKVLESAQLGDHIDDGILMRTAGLFEEFDERQAMAVLDRLREVLGGPLVPGKEEGIKGDKEKEIDFMIAYCGMMHLMSERPEIIVRAADRLPVKEEMMMEEALTHWASRDLKGATSWLDEGSELDQEQRDKADLALVTGLARSSMPHALDRVAAMHTEVQPEALRTLSRLAVNRQQRDALLELASEQPDGSEFVAELAGGMAKRLAKTRKFPEATSVVSEYLPSPSNDLLLEVASSDITAASIEKLGWLIEKSGPVNLPGNVAHFVKGWAAADFNAAASYLNTLEHEPFRDDAVRAFATTIARSEPESALEWASEISDETLREEAVIAIRMHWESKDRDAAAAYFEQRWPTPPRTPK